MASLWCTKGLMKLYFSGPKGHLVLTRKTGENVLRAMGYTGDVDAGEIPLVDAYIGVEKAKRTLSGHELDVLLALIGHMDDLSEEFIENLEWA
jgi:hypothetical protein